MRPGRGRTLPGLQPGLLALARPGRAAGEHAEELLGGEPAEARGVADERGEPGWVTRQSAESSQATMEIRPGTAMPSSAATAMPATAITSLS